MTDAPGSRRELHRCFNCLNRAQSAWCAISGDDIAFLDRHKLNRLYSAGQNIFFQGDPCQGLFCIESGTAAIKKTDDQGNEILLRLSTGGDTLGYRTYFAGGHYGASAIALEDCRVCIIPKVSVDALLSRNPALALRFAQRLASDLESAEEHKLQASLSVRVRISHLLLALKERFGVRAADGSWFFTVPLSRQDMAAMVGTRPETVIRTLSELEADGLVSINRRQITIPALDPLIDATGIEQP